MKRKFLATFSILAIGLMLSSVSYGCGDVSPGIKATTIEKSTLPVYCSETVYLSAVQYDLFADDVQTAPAEKFMIVENCEALPVKVVEPAAVNNRWRSSGNEFITYNIPRSAGITKAKRNLKFIDTYRRMRPVTT